MYKIMVLTLFNRPREKEDLSIKKCFVIHQDNPHFSRQFEFFTVQTGIEFLSVQMKILIYFFKL